MIKELMAGICAVCPFCALKRRFPGSRYSEFLERIEKRCPFCRAYAEVMKGRRKRGDLP